MKTFSYPCIISLFTEDIKNNVAQEKRRGGYFGLEVLNNLKISHMNM